MEGSSRVGQIPGDHKAAMMKKDVEWTKAEELLQEGKAWANHSSTWLAIGLQVLVG